jgi:hypothetical protein
LPALVGLHFCLVSVVAEEAVIRIDAAKAVHRVSR